MPATALARWTTTIQPEELATVIDHCVVVDCRHDLFDLEAGRRAYADAHIPGAHFLHQDEDLAGATNGRNGRHPLPEPADLAARLRAIGLCRDQQLVAYDDQGGMLASRLWWLARWIGHSRVAVLDGGIGAWKRAGYPLSGETSNRAAGDFAAAAPLARAVSAADLAAHLDAAARAAQGGAPILLDARIPERYAGEIEPLDPVAGHIPGALNWPFQRNLRPNGRFKPAEALREQYTSLLGGAPAERVVHYCGSGITACHNMIAMELAGMSGSALYPGSWSEWCADPSRPIATGFEASGR
ncbi:MAG: sulfurtransferase [Burkholderiaceae bacterium]|nr:sulfurtransferase [Burkholderiaceae bacterium]